MTDWLPIIVGLCIVAFAVGIMRLAPNSAWAQELRRPYGIHPSGERGHRTRRDHARSAGLAAAATVALLATSYGAGLATDRFAHDASSDRIGMTYTFIAFVFAAMAALVTFRSFWKAMLWRVELPDTPDHRRGLANAIDHLLDDSLSSEERSEFLDVRYLHPQIEQVRRATLKLVAQHDAGLPEHFRAQIKQWTAGIRGSAS